MNINETNTPEFLDSPREPMRSFSKGVKMGLEFGA
jgi:hypothetical protein